MGKSLGFKDRVGEIHITNEGYEVEIIRYDNAYDCDILFKDGLVLTNRAYGKIKRGGIKNPNHKSVYGVAYIGVGKYSSLSTHKGRKIYSFWINMIKRCYSKISLAKHPSYIGCVVFESWCNFQVFAKWFEENYKEGCVLDKDILVKRNKVYSPETCAFVPEELNLLFGKNMAIRGKLPIGVVAHKNRFAAQMYVNNKHVYLGLFKTIQEAFEAYKTAKESNIKLLAEKHKSVITPECYNALINYEVEIKD